MGKVLSLSRVLPAWPRPASARSLLRPGVVENPKPAEPEDAGTAARRGGRRRRLARHEGNAADAAATPRAARRLVPADAAPAKRRRPWQLTGGKRRAACPITIRCRRGSRFALRTVPPHAGHFRRTSLRSKHVSRMSRLRRPVAPSRRRTQPAARGPAASAASLAAASSRASISWLFSPSRRIATVSSTCSRAPTTNRTGILARLCSRTL